MEDSNRYAHLDELNSKLLMEKNAYALVELTDEVMGICTDTTPDRKLRSKARAAFVSDLGANFPIGVFVYERHGTLGNWTVVFRMEAGQDEKHYEFIGAVVDATRDAPRYLSRCQTGDAIDTVARATERNKMLCKAMLNAVLPDGAMPAFDTKKKETEFLEAATHLILCLDGDDEKELIMDMRLLNCRGNTNKSKFELFWEYCSRTMEIENGSGAHHRRHAATDADTTNNVSYAPGLVSIPQLIRLTLEALEKDGKVKGIHFEEPSLQWVTYQMMPNNP